MKIEGTAIVLGNNVNTDLLHPPAYFSPDAGKAAAGAFAGLDLDIVALPGPPYVIVAGKNFGCGSSRESTLRALKKIGVAAIVAGSFSHIFFRNALAVGIPALTIINGETPANTGDKVSVDVDACLLANGPETLRLRQLEDLELDILETGGLHLYLIHRNWDWSPK